MGRTLPTSSARATSSERATSTRRDTNRTGAPLAGTIAAIALVPRLMTIGHFETTDEVAWMNRSQRFSDALLHLHPSKASASTGALATMPGVTTMWLGTVARIVWSCGRGLGLISSGTRFNRSAVGLTIAELFVAVTTCLLLALFVRLVWQWAGGVTAIVAGLIMATEPFFVAHGSVLHVDELTALFGVCGTVALLMALGVPRPCGARPRPMTVLAGLLLAAAFLTKVSAVSLAPGLLFVIAVVGAERQRRAGGEHRWRAGIARTARRLGPAFTAGFALVVVAWPALWADPFHQISLLARSAHQADMQHVTYFLGHATGTPGPAFYFVAAPLRMTHCFLLGSLVLGALALRTSARARLLALLALPQAIILSLASKQFDRYALPVLALLALIVGLGADACWHRLRRRYGASARVPAAGALAVVALVMCVNTAVVAPWGLAYYNPILGGSATAPHAILVGWGEGTEKAGAIIKAREGPACNVSYVAHSQLPNAFPCGHRVGPTAPADYVVLYVDDRQRMAPADLEALRRSHRLVATVRVRGMEYVDIYARRH